MANLGDVSFAAKQSVNRFSLHVTPDVWPNVSVNVTGFGVRGGGAAAVGMYLIPDGSVRSGTVPSGTGKLIAFSA